MMTASELLLLSNEEMAAADRMAVQSGVASLTLMENAGRAVAEEAAAMVPVGARVAILCGPGNNGGDGFVAARLLEAAGRAVRLALLGDRPALRGDAARMAGRYAGPVLDAGAMPGLCREADLSVDALFGAGLSRPLEGDAALAVAAINSASKPVLAVDVPSGLDGTTGEATGPVVQATRTVTFFRLKPGHLLLPGRELCGSVRLADIGLPASVLDTIGPSTWRNQPALWRDTYPLVAASAHKYTRGHAVVVSGPPDSTGAARLGARAALRAGAGLVTVASPPVALPVNAAHLTAIMIKAFEVPHGLSSILEDPRKNAVLIGPGCGLGPSTQAMVARALASNAGVVLDADALTSFAGDPGAAGPTPTPNLLLPPTSAPDAQPSSLFPMIASRPAGAVVLTPHEGEFRRLFPNLAGSKLARARAAAQLSRAVIVLKGPDTVIASPDGRAAINDNAPPWLATAGSGDVLAGFVTGLLAQGMPAWPAACTAVWLHGECGSQLGPGLIAEDLPEALPRVVAGLMALIKAH